MKYLANIGKKPTTIVLLDNSPDSVSGFIKCMTRGTQGQRTFGIEYSKFGDEFPAALDQDIAILKQL